MVRPDLEEAVRKVSTVPCAVVHGLVEVWPLEQHAVAFVKTQSMIDRTEPP